MISHLIQHQNSEYNYLHWIKGHHTRRLLEDKKKTLLKEN